MLYSSPLHSVARFSGPDASAFLQSQLTNDVSQLAVGAWQWQAYCTAKGRMLATFALLRCDAVTYEALVHKSVIDALCKKLMMFRLRSKLSIGLAPDRRVLWDFGAPSSEQLQGHGAILQLTDGRALWLADALEADSVMSPAADDVLNRWSLASVNALLPEITASTSELFVPQMIGWDEVQPGGGVSFSKGCYPGQEVVARAHYRGAVKRHLQQITASGDIAPSEGEEITLPDGRDATVCNVARIDETRWTALVVASAANPVVESAATDVSE